MYLSGHLSIDPAQRTVIDKKPTHGLAHLAEIFTAGLTAQQEERETFTALSIMQQIQGVLRGIGIDNAVRFSADQTVIYEDRSGRPGDLALAIDHLIERSVRHDHPQFEQLSLLLEHTLPTLHLLLEIRVQRRHPVGEHPIQMAVNGLLKEFLDDTSPSALRENLSKAFSSQDKYDAMVATARLEFNQFLENLAQAYRDGMEVTQVRQSSQAKIIRPLRRVHERTDTHYLFATAQGTDQADPIFDQHQFASLSYLYCWLWAEQCCTHNIYCANCTLIDEHGSAVLEVGDQGFWSADVPTLNVDQPFAYPGDAEVTTLSGHAFSESAGDTPSALPGDSHVDASE